MAFDESGLGIWQKEYEPRKPRSRWNRGAVGYKRLRDGTWGVIGPGGSIHPGRLVSVLKRNGDAQDEFVESVIWRGDGLAIGKIAKTARAGY